MKLFFYLVSFCLVFNTVNAQENPDVFDISMEETSVSEPVMAPPPAGNVSTTPVAGNGQDPSVFDDMMETLFGNSALPVPQGDLKNETTAPAPLFSGSNEQPVVQESVMYDAEIPPPAPMIVQPILVQPAKPQARVITFDIAGIKLRMLPKEVFEHAINHGYKMEYMDKTSVNFLKWRLERECMDNGVFIFERKQDCVNQSAQKTGDYYINYMEFVKESSNEKIRAFFTSSFSGNKLYRVTYYNEGDNSLGDSLASTYIKEKRRNEFYNWVSKKYGNPTNPQTMTWGEGGSNPYFQAFASGSSVNFNLTLEDPMMLYEDSQAMRKADVKAVTFSKFSF